ncbi:Mus7/MMS22 family-domain-containing protein [Cyathus striatus]|nr:Mus7/MMS22 family-domain-containing protein [Cyathus striatus]
MKDDDYVETSDAEELEGVRALGKPDIIYDDEREGDPEGDIYRRDDFYSPRKRIKLDYNEDIRCEDAAENAQVIESAYSSPAQSPLFSSPVGSLDKGVSLFTPPSSKFKSPKPIDASSSRTSLEIDNDEDTDAVLNPLKQFCIIQGEVNVLPRSQSQDPLLLYSQEQHHSSLDIVSAFKPPLRISHPSNVDKDPLSSTSQSSKISPLRYPRSSPTPSRRRSPSCDPLSLFDYPSDAVSVESHMQVDIDNSTSNTRQTFHTPLHGPTKHLHTPTAARDTTPMSPLTPSPSPSPSPSPAQVTLENLPPSPGAPAAVIAESRYPLRPRNRAQIQPFTVEALIYRNTLKTAPEAIVKVRGVDDRVRSRHETERYEESQDQEYLEDANDKSQEEEHSRRLVRYKSKSKSKSPELDKEVLNYPGLEGLPSEDEEEEREMRKMSKEGRKVLKERERKKKEKEREERERQRQQKERERKWTRSFPLGNGHSSRELHVGSEDKTVPEEPRSYNSHGRVRDVPSSPAITSSLQPFRSQSPHVSKSPTINAADQHILDYYRQDDYQGLDDDGINSCSNETSYMYPTFEPDDDFPSNSLPNLDSDILQNTRETAIDISSEPDVDEDQSDKSSSWFDSKQKKALNRMFPAFMAKRYIAGDSIGTSSTTKSNVQHPGTTDKEAEELLPLRPGQTRVRLASNSRDVREIKGDTESSSDDDNASVRSEADDGIGRYHKMKKHYRGKAEDSADTFTHQSSPEIISIDSDTSTESDDDQGMLNDDYLQEYLKEEDVSYVGSARVRRMRDASLIDWMLSRARTVGTGKKKRRRDAIRQSRKDNDSSSKYKFDVITRDAHRYGRGKQTLLDFSNHTRESRTEGLHLGRKRRYSRCSNDRDGDMARDRAEVHSMQTVKEQIDHIPSAVGDNKKSRKQLQKERRARAKKQGLYTFGTGSGSRIETGRRQGTAFVTVDLEDESFHRALAPLSQNSHPNWAEAFRPPPSNRSRHKHHKHPTALGSDESPQLYDNDNVQRHDKSSKKRKHKPSQRQIQGDLDIPVLHSGINFALNTSIGKGFLHELVKVITSSKEPPMPSELSLQGFELGPSMGITAFCEKLGDICEGLFEFATGLECATNPEAAREYTLLMRTVCQLLSWHLYTASEVEKENAREQVKTHILRLTARIRETALHDTLLDHTFLSVCWFSVELSARLKVNSLPSPSDRLHKTPLQESCAILVHHLLNCGLHRTMEPVRSGNMDGSDMSHYSAELWVSLIHVLDASDSTDQNAGKRVHSFWKVILEGFGSREYTDKPSIQVSESIWRAIFSLCALSQFSVHGMTTSTPRLPACWDLVVEALKKIRLASKPEVDLLLDSTSLNKRDQYIGLVTTRCFHLWDRWHWKLHDASVLFNQLVEIFRSRKFANLRHEEADYPLFMRHRKWDLLSSYSDEDTAFIQFLKLIYHAANIDGPLDAKGELKPRCKKLLSLAIPVGVLPFTKASPPTRDDLSMLYNRFSAVAIAISLDPERYITRISQARSYVNFADVDDTTRFGIMSGVVSFGILMAKAKIKLDAIAGWIEDLSSILAKEMKEVPDTYFTGKVPEREHSSSRLHLFLAVQMLIGTVRQIVDGLKECKEYPEPMLLDNLKPIFRAKHFADIPKVAEEIRALTISYLAARAAVVPPPQRLQGAEASTEADEETQESQEYGVGNFSDFDFNDPSLIAALDGMAPEETVSNYLIEDTALRKAIYASNLQWLCFRFMRRYFPDPPPGTSFTSYAEECDKWISCWLGCANIDKCSGNKQAWYSCIDMRQNTWGKESSQYWQRRIDLGVMVNILELDPMAYQSFNAKVMGTVLESLVVDHITIEGRFVALVFSLDCLQHPLFHHVTCVTLKNEEDFQFSAEEFKALRIPLLQVAFGNLNRRILDDTGIDPTVTASNQEFIGMCIRMFSTMRAIVEKLKGNSVDGHRVYVDFCREIFYITQQYREVRSEARLQYWWNWGRTLEPT